MDVLQATYRLQFFFGGGLGCIDVCIGEHRHAGQMICLSQPLEELYCSCRAALLILLECLTVTPQVLENWAAF